MDQTNILATLDQFRDMLSRELFTLGDRPVSISSLIFFVLIIFFTWIISKYIRSLFDSKFSDRFDGGTGYIIRRLTHYGIMILGIVVAADFIGFDLTSLTVIAGFLSVGIGFGLQNIASNFISGLILMFERPISVGDIVTVDDRIGTIDEVGLRATILTTVDNIQIIIPNSEFVEESVTNWTRGDQKIRLQLPVGVAYGTDIERVKETLLEIAANSEHVLESPEPQVIFQEFGGSSLNFDLMVWVDSPRKRIKTADLINESINKVFEEKEIEMPFPQRDIHIRSSYEEEN